VLEPQADGLEISKGNQQATGEQLLGEDRCKSTLSVLK
jgi:hypothetical protein